MPTDLFQFIDWKSANYALAYHDHGLVIIVDKFLNEMVTIRNNTPRHAIIAILQAFGFTKEVKE